MIRNIVSIDRKKCIGCGLCARACHEGAIKMIDGKATLVSDTYCDGLGDCLPHCPSDAISIIKRESEDYILQDKSSDYKPLDSTILNWPIQIKLAPVVNEIYNNAHLLVAATCSAFSYKEFHAEFMQKRVLLIGCPKLDMVDYTRKLKDIIENNNIKSIALVIMEVPCCSKLEVTLKEAIKQSGKEIHLSIRVISIKGDIIDAR